MVSSFNKTQSFLAPRADNISTFQLNFLLINSPFVVIINNYKAKLSNLNDLRFLASSNNGFTYHPTKNVKTRAFKGFNKVLSPNVLNGLVVFVFFKEFNDFKKFLSLFEEDFDDLRKLSYFGFLVNGHVAKKNLLTNPSLSNVSGLLTLNTFSVFNKIIFNNSVVPINYSLNKIIFIINAYIKSIN